MSKIHGFELLRRGCFNEHFVQHLCYLSWAWAFLENKWSHCFGNAPLCKSSEASCAILKSLNLRLASGFCGVEPTVTMARGQILEWADYFIYWAYLLLPCLSWSFRVTFPDNTEGNRNACKRTSVVQWLEYQSRFWENQVQITTLSWKLVGWPQASHILPA